MTGYVREGGAHRLPHGDDVDYGQVFSECASGTAPPDSMARCAWR